MLQGSRRTARALRLPQTAPPSGSTDQPKGNARGKDRRCSRTRRSARSRATDIKGLKHAYEGG